MDAQTFGIIALAALFGPLFLAFVLLAWGAVILVTWALCRAVWKGVFRK